MSFCAGLETMVLARVLCHTLKFTFQGYGSQMKIQRTAIAIAFIGLAILCIAMLPGYSPVSHPFFAAVKPGQVEIIAHGAGQGVAPTNTLLGAQTAYAMRADIVEADVQLTRDDVLVLHHDDTLDRTTNLSGAVASLSWAQLAAIGTGGEVRINGTTFSGPQTRVARLDDVFDALPDARWNIEIKNDSQLAAQTLCQSIKRKALTQTVLVASFHDNAMKSFRRFCPMVATSMAPAEIRVFVLTAHLRLSRFVKSPAVAVQVPIAAGGFDLTDKRFVAALKARNIKLQYWTINEPTQMDALIQAGADGLLTDFVTRGQEARQRGLRAPRPFRP
jgi:glycerophosphoryl diester phosphodiesterase